MPVCVCVIIVRFCVKFEFATGIFFVNFLLFTQLDGACKEFQIYNDIATEEPRTIDHNIVLT